MRESLINKQKRALNILKILEKEFPEAKCALEHKNPFQLMIAVLLSAQSTDKGVNKITPTLFKIIKSPAELAKISQNELEKLIQSIGLYRNKAKNLRAIGKILTEKHQSKVPNTMQELISLPGIARKSANIILETGFGIIEGIAVDTHVRRISNRLNLSQENNPDKIEQDLIKIFPKKYWGRVNHFFVWHGRKTCTAKNPKCDQCASFPFCPFGLSK